MRKSAVWSVLVFLYLVFDFAHPQAPGVFSFEGDQLFIDGAVTLGKATPPKPAPVPEPHSALRVDDPDRVVGQTWSSRSETSRDSRPRTERRYSLRASDPSSPPSSSPDAH